ncbi:hypothetical protein [Gluconobacter sp. OJB]|uniref:hypothetical protein n=1 Tax=Gluconobacter sp. OJB TaxID=3145196 RepID=UPI0031F72A8B
MTMLANFVLETASSPGVGSFVLNGAVADRRAFSQAFPSSGRIFYFADDGAQAEWGVGTLTIGNPCTLARSRVIGNTQNTTDLVRFSGGVQVYNEIPAEFLVQLDENGAVSLKSLTVLSELLVPQVSDWTSYQAVGAAQADGRYVQQVIGDYGSIVGATIDNTTQRLAFQSSKGPWYYAQPSGDYATTVQVNTALSAGNSAQGTANSALAAANNANGNKLDITDGTATRMTVDYGSMRAQFQGDGNFVLYSGNEPVFSVSPQSINWNSHSFAFIDNLPMGASKKIVEFQVAQVATQTRINFPEEFSNPPRVWLTAVVTDSQNAVIPVVPANVDTKGFTTHNFSSTTVPFLNVLAIGDR